MTKFEQHTFYDGSDSDEEFDKYLNARIKEVENLKKFKEIRKKFEIDEGIPILYKTSNNEMKCGLMKNFCWDDNNKKFFESNIDNMTFFYEIIDVNGVTLDMDINEVYPYTTKSKLLFKK